jgi:DNA-directed RNA polymerase subunit M/transcription elongation factor TFIIS
MYFCVECGNMYYIQIDQDDTNNNQNNALVYYCRNCGHIDDEITKTYISVFKTEYKKSEKKFNHIINKYTKLDPTLPRISNIKCPNDQCDTNKDENIKKEIIYLRYDDTNMKYIYLCSHCDITWNTEQQ